MKTMKFFLILLTIIISFCYSIAMAETLSKEEIHDLFKEAKMFFHEGNETGDRYLYMKAIMRFERIARNGGIKNGKLYYNIGNTYFLMDDLGQAILNYRRAERLIPNDPNLRHNLEFAISKKRDNIKEKQQTRVLKTFLFFHYDLSFQERFIIFISLFSLFWAGMCLRLFTKRIITRWILVCAGILCLFFLVSLSVEIMPGWNKKEGVILAEEVVARKGNGKNYRHSFKEPLHAGTEFIMIEERSDWLQIELKDGRTCWIQKKEAGLL